MGDNMQLPLEIVLPDMSLEGMSDELADKVTRETERLLLKGVEQLGVTISDFDFSLCSTMMHKNGAKIYVYNKMPILMVVPIKKESGLEFEFRMANKTLH